ncbi:MAG: hypothetical protein HOZ81_23750 [Streptomyces sp.]|nr:hypothetical protein [Streptomyces sp.]
MITTVRLCVCHTELTDGQHLCQRCRAATAGRLVRMHALYRLLAFELQPATNPPGIGRVRLSEAPLPLSLAVLDLRGPGGMVGVLEHWRAVMQADRRWGEPAISGTIEARVRSAARGLELNLDWIAGSWARAADFATGLRQLDEIVVGIVCPVDATDRGTRLGPCPAETPAGLCGAILRYHRDAPAAVCPWCEVAYPPDSWADLKAWMDEDEHEEQLRAAA